MALTPEEQVEMEMLEAQLPPETFGKWASHAAMTGLQSAAKAAGALRATTTGPMTAYALQKMTGKPVFDNASIADSINPTNLKQYPSNYELFKEAGVGNPELSDAIPGYADPGTNHPWWQPEKHGFFDPSAAGLLQLVSDPAMWLGAGEAGAAGNAAKNILAKNAYAAKSNLGKAVSKTADAIGSAAKAGGWATGAKPIAMGTEAGFRAMQKIPAVGQVVPDADTIFNPLSSLLRGGGKAMYGASVIPVEHEGQQFGKKAIAETLYDAGISSPGSLVDDAKRAADALIKERNGIFQQAESRGATVDINKALEKGFDRVKYLRSLGNKTADEIANDLERELNSVVTRHNGIPTIPGTPADHFSMPPSWEVPPVPGVPAMPYTPQKASDVKTFLTGTVGQNAQKPHLSTPVAKAGFKDAANGLREEIEASVARSLGDKYGKAVENLNEEAGKLLGTRNTQLALQQRADKEMLGLFGSGGANAVGSAADNIMTGSGSLSLGGRALRLLDPITMPSGYYMRKAGNLNLLDRPPYSPWGLLQRGEEK